MPRDGQIYDLEVSRARGMPLWHGHPPFEVLTYRSPRGFRVQGDQEWLQPDQNKWNLGVVSDLVFGTTHSGTHIDALSHITIGEDDHWHEGRSANQHLGDFGPIRDDAVEIPPFLLRGVMLDVARARGVDRLPKGYGVTRDDLERAIEQGGVELRSGDAVLVRTGQMSVWPDEQRLLETVGSGLNLEAAQFLIDDHGAALVGNDTESFEQIPAAPDPTRPDPVHAFLLIERGIHIMENLYLEKLSHDRVSDFLLLVLPLKISGATGSMIRPVAVT